MYAMTMKIDDFLALYGKSTAETYRNGLNAFCAALGETKDTYKPDGRDHVRDIETFKDSLKAKSPLTMRCYLGAVKIYLTECEIPVEHIFRKQRRREKKLKGARPLTKDRLPTIEEMRMLLSHATVKDRAIILSLVATGCRIGELLNVTLDDLHLDETPVRLDVQPEYTKTGVGRTVFLNPEAVGAIKEWLKVRDEYIVAADGKIAADRGPKFPKMVRQKNDNRLFPLSYMAFIGSWRRLLRKAMMLERDKKTGRCLLHPHVFRKNYRTKMPGAIGTLPNGASGIDVVEALLGHSGYLTEAYRKFTDKELAAAYLIGMGKLSIFETEPDLTDLTEMRSEVNALKKQMEEKDRQIQMLMVKLLTTDEKTRLDK
jgi:integrase